MKKFLLALVLLLLAPKYADASLVTLESDGVVRINVLSSTSLALEIPRREYLKIRDVATSDFEAHSTINLSKNTDGRVSLDVITDNNINELDVTNYEDDLIEIEERGETRRVRIKTENGKFSIEERGVFAITDYPISIDPNSAELSVKTASGERLISILPYQAIESLVRAGTINSLPKEQRFALLENDKGELSYIVSGEKLFKLFNLVDYAIPITAQVSVSTGELVNLDQPLWLPVMNLLFG